MNDLIEEKNTETEVNVDLDLDAELDEEFTQVKDLLKEMIKKEILEEMKQARQNETETETVPQQVQQPTVKVITKQLPVKKVCKFREKGFCFYDYENLSLEEKNEVLMFGITFLSIVILVLLFQILKIRLISF